MSTSPVFVHLRVRSEFSITEGLSKVDHLAAHAAKLDMPALALADKGNLYGLVKFYNACRNVGVKPLIACELKVYPEADKFPVGELLFLVRNETGYRNLLKLVSKAHVDAQSAETRGVQEAWLDEHAEGLLVLSGGHRGTISQLLSAGKADLAEHWLKRCKSLWNDAFYLEVQQLGRPADEEAMSQTLALADKTQTPIVATHDACFLRPDDFSAHETRVCICEGTTLDDSRRPRRHSEQQYMKNQQEMAELFAQLPDALENTIEIAKRCSFQLPSGEYHLPRFSKGDEDESELLAKFSNEGLEKRRQAGDLADALTTASWTDYTDRLDFEISIIKQMGFAGYFLIVMEFVRWAKAEQIPVGPGRGSGAGSLVAYVLGITDVDPLPYNLLFERFLNPERKSMPDFDIDFCVEGRERVITHAAERYGTSALSQIITFGTMAARGVVRDVARAQGKSLGLADRLAKMIPEGPDVVLSVAMEEGLLKEFVKKDAEAGEIIEMAYKLEGVVRQAGKHPGGVVIAPGQLSDYVPVTLDEHGAILTQFDKDDVELVGLVKFDFLGLRTLTIIHQTVQTVNASRKNTDDLDITKIPLDDEKVFESLRQADTSAVFQLESRGMRELMVKLEPEHFEDIVALVALYRPGPLNSGMAEDFTQCRHGKAEVSYLHPRLEPLLKSTYGVILYQEQVMQIAQVLAGYSLGDADILRRAMGKKKPAEMAKQRNIFLQGAKQRGLEGGSATHIFDLIEKFAGYGFNRSHSVAYGLIAYQTAWLKAHHPAEFMAVTLSLEMHDTDKIAPLIATCRALGLRILKPDIQKSEHRFTVASPDEILYGLGALKGVGEAAVDSLVSERQLAGAYTDLIDFCTRQDKRMNKRALEALIKAGAVDSLAAASDQGRPHRAWLKEAMGVAIKTAEQQAHNESAGLVDIFGNSKSDQIACLPDAGKVPYWTEAKLLAAEYEALSLYFSGHPVDAYAQDLAQYGINRISQLKPSAQAVTVGALVMTVRKKRTRKGDTMAFLTLEDPSGRMDVVVQPELFTKTQSWLAVNEMLFATGRIEPDAYTGSVRMRAFEVHSTTMARSRFSRAICLTFQSERYADKQSMADLIQDLKQILSAYRGTACPVHIRSRSKQAQVELSLGKDWWVTPSDDCLDALSRKFGEDQVQRLSNRPSL